MVRRSGSVAFWYQPPPQAFGGRISVHGRQKSPMLVVDTLANKGSVVEMFARVVVSMISFRVTKQSKDAARYLGDWQVLGSAHSNIEGDSSLQATLVSR